MSRQVRIDVEAYEALESIAQLTGKPRSLCVSMIVTIYAELFHRLGQGDRLILEKHETGMKSELLLPLNRRPPD